MVFVGAGRLGFPDSALFAFALGCDLINVGREAMMAIGCIQAQRCHTGRCPTGVATQSRWLMHGLDPELKSHRAANYLVAFPAELLALVRSCGVAHPALVTPSTSRSSPSATGPHRSPTSSPMRPTGHCFRPTGAIKSKRR